MEQQTFLEGPGPGFYPLPEGGEVSTCRSCGARIIWSKTGKGNPIPLDTSPVTVIGGQRYAKTHFSTCPQGKEWSKPR